MSNNLISWSSKKQLIVTKLSTEVDYHAINAATSELIWELNLLPLGPSIATTYLTTNLILHLCMKHIAIDFLFVRDKVSKHEFSIHYIF